LRLMFRCLFFSYSVCESLPMLVPGAGGANFRRSNN
jgi:hypothetical protein